MSKVSAQFVGFKSSPAISNAVAAMIARGVAAVKFVNRLDLASQYASRVPSALVVFRDQAWQNTQLQGFTDRLVADPMREAKAWLAHHQSLMAPLSVAFEIMNEWEGWERDKVQNAWILHPDQIKAFAHYQAIIAEALAAQGRRVVMDNFSVSTPPYEAAQYLTESYEAANKFGSFVGGHGYNSPSLDMVWGPDGRPQDLTFRIIEYWRRINGSQVYPNVRLLLTEFGIDEIEGNGIRGWRHVAQAPAMIKVLQTYVDPILDACPQLVAAFWFRFGHNLDDGDSDPTWQYDALDWANPPRSDFDLGSYIVSHANVVDAAPLPAPTLPASAPLPDVMSFPDTRNIRQQPMIGSQQLGQIFPFHAIRLEGPINNGYRKLVGQDMWVYVRN